MPYGNIVRIEPEHGFGFIRDDGGMDWFFVADDVRGGRFAVEQQVIPIFPDDEIEQAFALGGEQSGPNWQFASDVLRHQPLQEAAHVLARNSDNRSIGEGGRGHGP